MSRSTRRILLDGNVSVTCGGVSSQPPTDSSSAPIASSAELERPSTINRYFCAMGRSAGWIKVHHRRTDSCISASLFSPTTRASIRRYTLLLIAWYETEISCGIGFLGIAVLYPSAILAPNLYPYDFLGFRAGFSNMNVL